MWQVCFVQVNILTHIAQVPYECYQPEKIEKTRKKMKEQDLQELYGVSESRNITVDEMPKTSCNDGTCKEISDSELVVYF